MLALGWFGLARQKLFIRFIYHEPTPPLLTPSKLPPILASAPVLEDPPLCFLSLAQFGWAVDWWECKGHLINVRVCLLPSADKDVLHTTKGFSSSW